jgi:FdrA protein
MFLLTELRRGAYYDSVVLMQLQRALATLPGVQEAAVVMGVQANKDLLAQSGLLTPEAQAAKTEDLVIVLRGTEESAGQAALGQIDALLAKRSSGEGVGDYRPKSIESAAQMLPQANWVLVSTPGRYAAGVAREALRLGKHVFVYSDNVSLEDEVSLKQEASAQGLLVLGPDCGTAIINGVGLGFANRVRRGAIGVIGASGTGLQQVTARIHQLGGGITHAIGTGGRDLSAAVGGITARQALHLLQRDAETQVIVFLSKPPAPQVAEAILNTARGCGKPLIVNFIGYQPDESQQENVYFAATLDAAAALAVEFADLGETSAPATPAEQPPFAATQRYLRGLYSGGTLAYEAQWLLRPFLAAVYSNAPLEARFQLAKASQSHEHTIVDLGDDEFTVGRLHPMLDHELRLKRILQEAADPGCAVLLLDVVLGNGAHPDPAAELAPAIAQAQCMAQEAGRRLEVIAVVVGTDEDPQDLPRQVEMLEAAGAAVELEHETAVRRAGELVRGLARAPDATAVDLAVLHQPLAAINVGLASFTESLNAQGASVITVDWRPPAAGNERLAGILARMKSRSGRN